MLPVSEASGREREAQRTSGQKAERNADQIAQSARMT